MFFIALRDPHRQTGVSQAAEKLDPEGGRGPQRLGVPSERSLLTGVKGRVLVAGEGGGGFNPRIKPTESARALQQGTTSVRIMHSTQGGAQ